MKKKESQFFVGYSRVVLVKGICLSALATTVHSLFLGVLGAMLILAYILVHEGGHLLVFEGLNLQLKKFYVFPLAKYLFLPWEMIYQ